jgi:Prion-inhibition and propagation
LAGYEVITSALEASDDSRCLSVQFEVEQSRLRDFIRAAGLADGVGEDGVNRTLLTNTTVLLNILSEIKLALAQYAHNEEYREGLPGEYTNPTISNDLSEGYGSLFNRLSVILRRAPESLGVVRSFTWSILRKSESEKVLQRLGRFNDFLHELLDAQQLRSLQDQQQQKYMELVQMRNSLDDIRKLTEAAHASRNVHSRSDRWQHTIDAELENLAAFKALYTSLLTNNTSQADEIKRESSRIHFQSHATGQRDHPRAIYRLDGNDAKEVWINWQDKDIPNDDPTLTLISPMEELTILLMAPKPDEFCIPTCVGYSILQQGEAQPRPALIFENPAGIGPQVQPVSLFHAVEQYPRPSLTHRIALAHKIAQCLLYLHAVNWLHKALRSSNILFFPSPDADPDVRSPYMTGFDNSRRSRFNEATSEVPRVGRMEVYRHPDTQLDGPMLSYRKTFDIYSLGLILVEIALWKPIVSVMGIEETVDQSPRATSNVQERWLTSEPGLLISLRAEVGEKYAGVVETCLKGRDAFGIDRKDAETSANTGMTIQREFNTKVVRSLAEIVV